MKGRLEPDHRPRYEQFSQPPRVGNVDAGLITVEFNKSKETVHSPAESCLDQVVAQIHRHSIGAHLHPLSVMVTMIVFTGKEEVQKNGTVC